MSIFEAGWRIGGLAGSGRFSAPLFAERVLVESVKSESMWQDIVREWCV